MEHGLLTSEQKPFKSCITITNLIETLYIISDSLNKGSDIILIILDFDKVCHNSLSIKLAALTPKESIG